MAKVAKLFTPTEMRVLWSVVAKRRGLLSWYIKRASYKIPLLAFWSSQKVQDNPAPTTDNSRDKVTPYNLYKVIRPLPYSGETPLTSLIHDATRETGWGIYLRDSS